MRKLSLIMVAFALVMTSVTSAAVVTEDVKNNPTEEQIRALLENPTFEILSDEKAFVTFMLNEDHEIVVLTVDTDNSAMEKFVKSRLNYHKIESVLKVGQEYKVPITIHYEA
jgi:NMD protein affecting ribosome stability and mRNA decay